MTLFVRRLGECEEKCSAFSDLTLSPNCSAMTRDDAAHDGKADSGPLKLAFGVESLKHAKQAVRVFGLEADAIIAHENKKFVLSLFAANFDDRFGSRSRILDCIREQIDKDLLEQAGIGFRRR